MIIAIAGTHGAGKGAVVEYLVAKKGFIHLSARELIKEEVVKRGLEPTRPNIGAVVTDMRMKVSPTWVVETLLARAGEQQGADVVIESIYTLDEVAYLHEHGAIILAVDADIQKRYERIAGRKSETDHVTFEEFSARQKREMSSNNPQSQNVAVVMKEADYVIQNDGSLKELHARIEEVLRAENT